MRQLLSIFFTITMLMVLGVACVEDRELVLPSQGEQTGGEDNKNDDENKEDEGADDSTEDEKGDDTDDGKEEPPIYNDYPNTSWAQGELDWVFDMNVLPEIRIEISVDEWNDLLEAYDRDNNTNSNVHCNVNFKSKGEEHDFVDAGLRLRGNTSRRRPEGNGGEMHRTDNTDWHH